MCFSFVFAALIEYAGVHFFTKNATKDVPDDSDEVGVGKSVGEAGKDVERGNGLGVVKYEDLYKERQEVVWDRKRH